MQGVRLLFKVRYKHMEYAINDRNIGLTNVG